MNIKYINTSALFNGLDGTTINNSTRLCNKNGITYIEFTPFDKFDWVKLHFSTRLGGVSEGIYSSMNFSFDRGDSYDNVYKNYELFLDTMELKPENCVCTKQTHTTNVLVADSSMAGMGLTKPRSYDNVVKGDEYINVKPVYHIGFLNYTLFPEYPEFFAKYRMMNIKNHNVYTTKFNLYVVDLTQIELATQEDVDTGLVYWTQVFKAKTWEELRQMAERHQELQEATEALYVYNQDEIVKEQCRARQDYYNHERGIQKRLEEARIALEESKTELMKSNAIIESQKEVVKKVVSSYAEKMHITEKEACKQLGIKDEIDNYSDIKNVREEK